MPDPKFDPSKIYADVLVPRFQPISPAVSRLDPRMMYDLGIDLMEMGGLIVLRAGNIEIVTRDGRNWSPNNSNGYGNYVDDRAEIQAKLKEYIDLFERLKKQATPTGTVVRVKGKKTSIVTLGKPLTVETPPFPVKPGDTVKLVADTMQILERDDDPPEAGEVVSVTRVVREGLCEIERGGSARTVAFGEQKIEDGDRVVLDPSGSVVIASLGRPRAEGVFAEATGVTWDDVGGLEEAKRILRDAIEAPVRHAEAFRRYGRRPSRGALLYGPAGCGKTLLGKAAATALAELHGKASVGAFRYVKGPELLDMYVGNTEARIRRLFDDARRFKKRHGFAPIVFIDEADAILGKRGAVGFGMEKTIVPQFLAEMDGLDEAAAFVLLATNRPGALDPAIVRDGRIDRRILIGRPSVQDAAAIVRRALRGKPLRGDLGELADAATLSVFDGKRELYRAHLESGGSRVMPLSALVNGAMLAGVVDRACALAMERDLGELSVVAGASDGGLLEEDLVAAVDQVEAEARHVNHDDELFEFVTSLGPGLVRLERGGGSGKRPSVIVPLPPAAEAALRAAGGESKAS